MSRPLACVLVIISLSGPQQAAAQGELRPIATSVSYVSGKTIYLGAGRTAGLEIGDSLLTLSGDGAGGILVISAVSASSSASLALDSTLRVEPGDSAVSLKLHPLVQAREPTVRQPRARPAEQPDGGTRIHGRIAGQLFASRDSDGRWDILQPSLIMRFDISRILGTDLAFSFFGRTSRDFSRQLGGFGNSATLLRLYDFSLRYGATEGWFGLGLGRIISRNVAGLGAFDGGELLVRFGRVTLGVLGGGQPDYRTSSVDPDRRKVAGYANLRFGDGPWSRNDITVAYGRQYFRGTLDRDFIYLQGSFSPSPRLFFYQSAEIDLHELRGGQSQQSVHLTNTFVTLSWLPAEWLSTSAGYDAARPVVLLESMKTFSDSLLARDLQQGLRASATVRLPMRLTATLSGGLRLRSTSARQAHTYGGGIRAANLGGAALSASVQYLRARALYSEGDDITGTLESAVTHWITASLRFNRYAYTLTDIDGGGVATTLSLAASFRLAGSWYALANLDRLWDQGRSAYRVLAELSYHF